jgi:hypothetical protein
VRWNLKENGWREGKMIKIGGYMIFAMNAKE